MKRERAKPQGRVSPVKQPYMEEISASQQLFSKTFREAFFRSVAGRFSREPRPVSGHMASAEPIVKTNFRKLFEKFSTTKPRNLQGRVITRSHMGRKNPAVNGLYILSISKSRKAALVTAAPFPEGACR